MSAYLSVLALALLPVLGNLIGTAAAELSRTPRWVIGAALHAAAGVAVALVSVDLMPRILATTGTLLFLLMFVLGAALAYLLAQAACWVSRRVEGGSAGAWVVYMATAADLLSDGLMTGVSSAVSPQLGLLLALSQVVANIPAGFAALSNFRAQEVPRRTRLLSAASFVIPVIVGVTVGFTLLRGASETAQDAALGVIVGILLVTTIEDLVPEADKPGTKRLVSTAAFVGGFIFFAVLASYLE
ncbi:ZIP family metal transporter [Sphingomonas sp. LHG3406-1]|uniref:ZIP family metal transporter n=1 Tax=Sphingomonas sp. LHG3406-1 TaxID=2804617 RepID=UPI00260452F3|nr:ZIP family metal transporter [Sphingomonas sp. LHG3406-1]